MYIYDIFGIKDAEFFNINTEQDIPVSVRPYTVEILGTKISKQCNETVLDWFNCVHDKMVNKDIECAINLFSQHLHEPKENCLGYSNNTTNGTGLATLATDAMHKILGAPHLIGAIGQIADLQLYVENIMYDRISDIFTNVARNDLNNYTLEQCEKYNMMHLVQIVNFGPYWDKNTHSWVLNEKKKMLVVNGKPILLTPKNFLRGSFDPNTMYTHVVLEDWINLDLRRNISPLIKEKKDGTAYIKKKDKRKEMKDKNFVPTKAFMVEYAKSHLNITKRLRQKLKEHRFKRLQKRTKKKK